MNAISSDLTPRISAVICTRNRADKIGAAVASVLANNHPSFDLTVIDQSTDEKTRDQLESLHDPRLRYFHSDLPGLSRAYNRGIRESTGPVIAFTDDDCIVPSDWLRRIEEAFDADPEAGLLYGQVLPISENPDDRMLTPALGLKTAERLSRREKFRVIGMGANFAARRKLFETVGLFDEVLGGGGPLRSSQDFDLAYRTYKAGATIVLRPEVTLLHDGQRSSQDWPRLFRDYGVGDGGFYSKHVRCGDPYALFLLTRQICHHGIRVGLRPLLRRDRQQDYLVGVFVGMKASLKFKVDRQQKCYSMP